MKGRRGDAGTRGSIYSDIFGNWYQMLKDQLQTVVDPSGYAAILMTQKEANVRFYKRLGFEVESKLVLGKGKNAFTNWCLLRQPI